MSPLINVLIVYKIGAFWGILTDHNMHFEKSYRLHEESTLIAVSWTPYVIEQQLHEASSLYAKSRHYTLNFKTTLKCIGRH